MANPKSKKARVSKPKGDSFESSSPQDLIFRSRDAAIKQMATSRRKDEFDDLDIAIKTVRALVITNNEIWNRCKDYHVNDGAFKMTRYDEIQVWKHEGVGMIKIGAWAKDVDKTFDIGPMNTLPGSLQKFESKRKTAGNDNE